MKVHVKVKPAARMEFIEKIDDTHFFISVKEPPVRGLANQAVMKKLAEYFKVTPLDIILKTGFSSKEKIFEINI
jgi:uncharacterized protein